MNKSILTILLALALAMSCVLAAAEDAVSSATVDVAAFPTVAEHENANVLVIYFSTDDTVKAVALTAAEAMEADVFEIVSEQPYTDADLAQIRFLARDAQFYWDFVFVENAEGAHNPTLTYECLDKAEELCNKALALVLALPQPAEEPAEAPAP